MRALAAAVCWLLVAAVLPAAGWAGPAVGVYMADEDFRAGARGDAATQVAAAAGAGFVRKDFLWKAVEPYPGQFDWRTTDRAVVGAAAAGLRVIPTLVGAPDWATGQAAPESGTYPPADPAAFGRFAAAVAARYGPGGNFMQHPAVLRQYAIRTWEVWNEPNIPAFWRPEPDPLAYTALLAEGARALRSVDPGAEIVMAGLPDSLGGMEPREFLGRVYAAGGAPHFDTLAIHPYAPDVAGLLTLVERMRGVADAAGDAATPIRVTEFGWATGGEPSLFTTDERGQAQLVAEAVVALRQAAARLQLRSLVYFKWRDHPRPAGASDLWPHYAGLLRADGSGKPSLNAFATAIAQPLDAPARTSRRPLRVRAAVTSALAARVRRHGLKLRAGCSRDCALTVVVSLETGVERRVRRVVARAAGRARGTRARRLTVRVGRRDLRLARAADARLVVRVGARAGDDAAIAGPLKVRFAGSRVRVFRGAA
jgi:hypothetical protein